MNGETDLFTSNHVPFEREISFPELKRKWPDGRTSTQDSLIWDADNPTTSHFILSNSTSITSRSLIDWGL